MRILFIVMSVLSAALFVSVYMLDRAAGYAPYLFELALVVWGAFLIFFYRRAVRPFITMSAGLDMLRSQDWNSGLRPVGQADADRVARMFNELMSALSEQRVRYEEQSHLLQALMERTPAGVVVMAEHGSPRVMMCNPAARGMLPGLEEGCELTALDGPLAEAMAAMSGTSADGGTDLTGPEGEVIRLSSQRLILKGVPHRFYMLANVTDTVIAAERRGYEKVIRIMAHEVNNTVAGMVSALDTTAELMDGRPVQPLLRACSERAVALSGFIDRYADVVRLPEPRLLPLSPAALIGRTLPFVQSLSPGPDISVRADCGSELPDMSGDAVLLEQVLVNLVKNAVESIASGSGQGTVTVGASASDGFVVLSVTDDGPGLSGDTRSAIYTPFYTSKPGGRGIGLMLVRDVARRHGGSFGIVSRAGLTVASVRVPVAAATRCGGGDTAARS